MAQAFLKDPIARHFFEQLSFHQRGIEEEQRNKLRILYAAASLFANRGYDGTSVREIVEAAGVTKPTLYYYFKNKEELYVQLVDIAIAIFGQILDKSLQHPGDMRTRLRALLGNIYQLFQDHVDFLRLVNSMVYGPQDAMPRYSLKWINQKIMGTFVAILQDGADAGEMRSERINDVLLLLIGIFRSMQALLVLKPEGVSLTQKDIGRAVDLIFEGAAAPRLNKEAQP